MAKTAGLFGGFAFDPEVFADFMAEQATWTNAVIASGIVREDSTLMNLIGEKGNVATIPMYTPVSIVGNMPLNNDGKTNNVPVAITGKKQTTMLIQIMKSWKSTDFTKELTGADPIGFVRQSVADYYAQAWQWYLLSIAKASMGVAALSSHVHDISSVTSGTVIDTNKVQADTLIYAEQKALGDMSGNMGLLVMHSMVYARYKALGLVDYNKYTIMDAIEREVELPTIGGKIPLVTDRMTVETDSYGNLLYSTYLFGEGAFLSADKTNYEKPYYSDYDPETSAGVDKLYTKQGKVLHPNGLSFDVTKTVEESPTLAELSASANWSLVADPKNVRIGVIKSNG